MPGSSPPRYVHALRFNWLTRYYDIVVRATTRERVVKRSLIAEARITAGMRVLELASGTGTLAIWIKQEQPLAEVTGVDGDPAILTIADDKARRLNTVVQFDQGMSDELPYADSTFDRVVSSLFFHHLDWRSKQETVHEVFRVLKPGAELHVADWGLPSNIVMRGLFLFIQLLDGFRNTQDNVSGRLIELFKSAGFAEVSQQRAFGTIFGTLALYRAVKPGPTENSGARRLR